MSYSGIGTNQGYGLVYNGVTTVWANPFFNVFIQDDFVSGTINSMLAWREVSSGTGAIALLNEDIDDGHPGSVQIATGTTTTGSVVYNGFGSSGNPSILIGGGQTTITYVVKIDTLSTSTDTFGIIVGLTGNTNATLSPSNGVYFSYSNSGSTPDWYINCTSGSSNSQSDSTVAVGTSWTKLQIVINASATSATFFINGTNVGSVSSNLPISNNIGPYFLILKSAGTNSRTMSVDYFSYAQTLTSSR